MSTRQLTDATQQITDTYTYDAFGLLLDRSGATENNYLYTGEQYDPNVGFYYLRARYYNASIGRFLTVDPWMGSIYDPVSLHRYLYCKNNPLFYVDWSGLYTIASLFEISTVQSILAKFEYLRGVEFQLRMKIIASGANIMGITLKTFLPDEILQLKVNIAGTTLTIDQWLTGVSIATAAGSLTLSFSLMAFAFQFRNAAAGVISIITFTSGYVSLNRLPQFLEDAFNYKLFY